MTADTPPPLVDIAFDGTVIEWRGPAPFHFVAVPAEHAGEIAWAARVASYGWGVVPVEVTIGATQFATSLFPSGESYLVPLKVAVRKATGVALGDTIRLALRIAAPD